MLRHMLRHPMLVINTILLIAIATAGCWRVTNTRVDPQAAPEATPADLFMQSVATEDGKLGWMQLCPDLQVQLPRDVLEQQTEVLRSSHQEGGVTLTIDHIGDSPRAAGGQTRVYIATAHGPDGSTGQKTYILQTQSSGCVESVNQ